MPGHVETHCASVVHRGAHTPAAPSRPPLSPTPLSRRLPSVTALSVAALSVAALSPIKFNYKNNDFVIQYCECAGLAQKPHNI